MVERDFFADFDFLVVCDFGMFRSRNVSVCLALDGSCNRLTNESGGMEINHLWRWHRRVTFRRGSCFSHRYCQILRPLLGCAEKRRRWIDRNPLKLPGRRAIHAKRYNESHLIAERAEWI